MWSKSLVSNDRIFFCVGAGDEISIMLFSFSVSKMVDAFLNVYSADHIDAGILFFHDILTRFSFLLPSVLCAALHLLHFEFSSS
jgi:hypothetical protein